MEVDEERGNWKWKWKWRERRAGGFSSGMMGRRLQHVKVELGRHSFHTHSWRLDSFTECNGLEGGRGKLWCVGAKEVF